MNKIFKLFFALLFISTIITKAQVTGVSIPAQKQTQTNWCWATVGQQLYWAYKTGSISQCNFVEQSRILENNSWWQCGQLPSTGNPCTTPANFNFGQYLVGCGGSLKDVLSASYAIPSTSYSRALTQAELTSALSAKKLVVAQFNWNVGGAHVVVITRYKSGNVSFNESIDGSKYTFVYNSFKNYNNTANWGSSLSMNNGAVYGTTLYKVIPTESVSPKIDEEITLTIFPNPASNVVTLLSNNPMPANSVVTINDLSGREVLKYINSIESTKVKLNIENITPGLYTLNSDFSKKVNKLIIN